MSLGSAKILQGGAFAALVSLYLAGIWAARLHVPLGSALGILPIGIAIDVVIASLLFASTWVLHKGGVRHALILPLLAVGSMILFTVMMMNGLNVLLDTSPIVQREMELVDMYTVGNKGSHTVFLLRSTREPTETVELQSSLVTHRGGGWQRGQKYLMTTRAGALGRQYALKAEPTAEPQ